MRIVSWNINGLESCLDKGLMEFIDAADADFYCFQEVRTRKKLSVPGYFQYWNLAARKGYSGTLVLAKTEPSKVIREFQNPSVSGEGRLIALEYSQFVLVNVYVPNSQSSLKRLEYRAQWDAELFSYLCQLEKPVILCGDFNVAQTYIDIFPENLRNDPNPPGFLSQERDALNRLIDAGFIDVFRHFFPNETGAYTWWSNRGNKRKTNQGWRLDYFFVSESLLHRIEGVEHNTDIYGSDHCPITLTIAIQRPERSEQLIGEELAEMWNGLDWASLEQQLLRLQQSLTKVVYAGNAALRVSLQKRIVRSFAAKALAVRHVVNTDATPGVDGVKWDTAEQRMRAALSLTSKNYHHSPYRRVEINDKRDKKRYANVPTAYDKAMQTLYAYSLDPVAEATGERKSFAFRKGRSTFDCHAYICKALEGEGAPQWVLRGDVKAYYDSISQEWLLKNIPMDTKVLREFIKAGAVFGGMLYPTDVGISHGASLSPILGNMVLDGLQEYIYQNLYGNKERDYRNGNLVRFADDFIVTARSAKTAHDILYIVKDFLAQRGLVLSDSKSFVTHVSEGFTFMSREYRVRNGVLDVRPSDKAVADFENRLSNLILPYRGSQKNLILKLNRMLSGWANYHRITNAHDAFRRIDAVVQSLLVKHAKSLHPHRQWGHIRAKYWFKDAEGDYIYALPDNRAIQLIRLGRAVITDHTPVKTNFNPYLDQAYYEQLLKRREIEKVSGAKLRGIWNRQNGVCYYCGRPMLPDHRITLVTVHFALDEKRTRYAYVHQACLHDEFERVDTVLWDNAKPIDVAKVLSGVQDEPHSPDDPYKPLRDYFRLCNKSPVTLTFAEIETILGDTLDWEAYFFPAFWYDEAPGFSDDIWNGEYPFRAIRAGKRDYAIAPSWLSQGYVIQRLRLSDKKIVLRKEVHGMNGVQIPNELLSQKIPKDAVYELNEFFDYIKRKYEI